MAKVSYIIYPAQYSDDPPFILVNPYGDELYFDTLKDAIHSLEVQLLGAYFTTDYRIFKPWRAKNG